MSEVTFAKSFLTTLDKRAIKLPSDHVSDPRKYPNQSPYTLPKQTHPFQRKQATQSAAFKTITITIKPMKSGETITLTDISLDASIHDVKTQYSEKTSQSIDKIKLLLNKKPAADLKTLKDLGVGGDVEFSAMVMSGSGAVGEQASVAAKTAASPTLAPTPSEDKMDVDDKASHPGSEKAQIESEKAPSGGPVTAPSGPAALNTPEFWKDLEDYLSQRLRDTSEATKLTNIFKDAWIAQA